MKKEEFMDTPLYRPAFSRILCRRLSAPLALSSRPLCGRTPLQRTSSPFSRFPLLPFFSFFLFLLLAFSTFGGELFSGRLYTVPEKLYVNQPFEIHFDLELSPGSEVEDLRIHDFPNDSDLLSVGPMRSVSNTQGTRDGKAVSVLHFSADARCLNPVEQTFSPTLQCMIVERRTSGFFSHWQSHPAQISLAAFLLRVRPLPAAGRPASFSGAIGTFRLTGRLSPTVVRPGDITTLTLDLFGEGWLGSAVPPEPAVTSLFKTYPAKETLREPLHVTTEQVLIPATTNATRIAAVSFSFFNPASERYETTSAGPFRLTFLQNEAPKADEVRIIQTTGRPAAAPRDGPALVIHADPTLRQAAPLIAVGLSAVIGLLLFFMLYGRHTRMALLAAAAALALGAASGHRLSGRTVNDTHVLAHRAEVRFAPSQTAAVLFSLNPGTPVIPLENVGIWTRIDASGLRGWITSSALPDLSRKTAP